VNDLNKVYKEQHLFVVQIIMQENHTITEKQYDQGLN